MKKLIRLPLHWSFILLGLCFLCGSAYHLIKVVDLCVIKDSKEVTGTIDEVRTTKVPGRSEAHDVYVSFVTHKNETHVSLLDTYVEGMAAGDNIEIIYNKNNPDEIMLKWSGILLVLIFGVIGFSLIGGTLIVHKRYKRKIIRFSESKAYR